MYSWQLPCFLFLCSVLGWFDLVLFFFKQKTAYEMRISDWSSDVCSSDLFRRADPIASALIGLLILPRTWRLLREAVDVLLEATPKGVDLNEVRRHLIEAPGVTDVHDLHAWTITSGLRSEERRVGQECVSTFESRG